MNKKKLKPCPFCGAEGKKLLVLQDDGEYYVQCDNYGCGALGPYKDLPTEAVEAWNKRATA